MLKSYSFKKGKKIANAQADLVPTFNGYQLVRYSGFSATWFIFNLQRREYIYLTNETHLINSFPCMHGTHKYLMYR
jgi:hypothetical protein